MEETEMEKYRLALIGPGHLNGIVAQAQIKENQAKNKQRKALKKQNGKRLKD